MSPVSRSATLVSNHDLFRNVEKLTPISRKVLFPFETKDIRNIELIHGIAVQPPAPRLMTRKGRLCPSP